MTNNPLNQEEFIALFQDARFRYIHDSIKDVTQPLIQGNNKLDLSWNKKGYGVFYTVNGFPSTGEAKEANLISLNANYVDFDVPVHLPQEEKTRLIQETIMGGLEAGAPGPTIVNRTQKGAHLIWLFDKPLAPTPKNVEKWREVQKRLVHCFKGDKNPVDPSRVLRLPFTMHLKDPENPFEIKVQFYNPEARYTLGELDEDVPKYSEAEIYSEKRPAAEILRQGVKVGEGLRHMAMAQVAGLALSGVATPEQIEMARMALYWWDREVEKSPEPFHTRKKELDDTIDGIAKRELAGRGVGKNTKAPAPPPHLWTIGEILTHDFGEQEWLVEMLIPKEGLTALSGNPGDNKTWTAIHKALCVARGIPVFGKFATTQGSVLIIDEEDHIRVIQNRLKLLGAKETDPIYYMSQSGFKVDDEIELAAILTIVREKQIKFVVLDSLIRIHKQDENDSRGMATVFACIQKIVAEGVSILFTHHHRKQGMFGANNPGQNMRGSSDILAAVDCHITIEKKKDEPDRLIIKQTKLRQAEALLPFEIQILKENLDSEGKPTLSGFEYAGGYDEKKLKAEEAAGAVVVFLTTEGMQCRADIVDALKGECGGKTAIEDGIKLAEGKSEIERVPKEELAKSERKHYYRVPGAHSTLLPASEHYIEAGKQEGLQEALDGS